MYQCKGGLERPLRKVFSCFVTTGMDHDVSENL
jgi:hypothetical protein